MCDSDAGGCVPSSELTRAIIASGLEVHRALGPGLLESAYEHCLAHDLTEHGHAVLQLGLLFNFKVALFKNGIRRLIL